MGKNDIIYLDSKSCSFLYNFIAIARSQKSIFYCKHSQKMQHKHRMPTIHKQKDFKNKALPLNSKVFL